MTFVFISISKKKERYTTMLNGIDHQQYVIYLILALCVAALITIAVVNYWPDPEVFISVNVASTQPISLQRGKVPTVIDDVPVQRGYSVLVKDQLDHKENGIYEVESKEVWNRSKRSSELKHSQNVFVNQGDTNENKTFTHIRLDEGGSIFQRQGDTGLPDVKDADNVNGVLVNRSDGPTWSQHFRAKRGYHTQESPYDSNVLTVASNSVNVHDKIDSNITPPLALQKSGGLTEVGGPVQLTNMSQTDSLLSVVSGRVSAVTLDGLSLVDNTLSVTAAGVADHGALTGLDDDDHTQYHNDTRADAWLATKDTDDISEGATNFYYTQARFDSAFTAKDTDDLTEGATNRYYSSSLFDTDLATKDTDDLSEGATNFYYTQARFDSAFTAKDTDDLSEGITNRYYSSSLFNTDLATKDTEIRVTWPHPFKLNVLTDNGYQIPLPSFDWLLSQMKARNKRKGVHLNVNGWRNHPEHVKKMMEVLYTYERACYDAMKAVRTHTQKKFHIEEQKILFNISRFSTDTNIKEANSYKDLVQKQVYNLITRILAIQDKEAKERLPVYVATSEKKNTNLYKIKKQGDNEEKSGSRRLYLTTSIPLSDNMQILIPDSDDIGYYFIKRGDEIKSVSKNLFDSMPYDMKSIRLLVRSNRRLMQRVAREETSYEDFLAQS
jgi:hypothetical protein